MRTAGWIILVAIVLIIAAALILRRPAPLPRMHYEPLAPVAPAVMVPMSLPDEQRWRDIADVRYSDRFIAAFTYGDEGAGRVTVQLQGGGRLQMTLVARGLKPNFAYQVKLLGTVPLRGATGADQGDDAAAWSSYQLGRMGRWWCEQCGWNVADADLAEHVGAGHEVTGYLLADWLVTDGRGDAGHSFALDSSYHVLWRDDQRRRRRFDTRHRGYELHREAHAYPSESVGQSQRARIFAEWEVGRPLPGRVQLRAGEYEVAVNLTEESFHANLSERDEFGGFWARVLQTTVSFRAEEVERR